MFESLGLENWTPTGAALLVGLLLGAIFGVAGHLSAFCLRRTLVGKAIDKRSALAVWSTALLMAVMGTQVLVATGLLDFSEHRYLSNNIPLLAIGIGGLCFGVGMMLTRGCVSRLTVLSGSGNLRAISVLLVFAVVAHATLKGILSPVRTWLGGFEVSVGELGSLANLPGGAWLLVGALLILVAGIVYRSSGSKLQIVLGGVIGLLVPLAWLSTGYILVDDFDPIPMESLSFTLPSSQMLFWLIASTSIAPGFGVGLVGGVLAGSLVSHLLKREFRWQSFESPQQTGRYFSGAVLMGIGGVLAGGCSVGAGLSGVSSLGLSAVAALVSIIIGGLLAATVVDKK